jgi:hypothetical protein
VVVHRHGLREVERVDLPVFGRAARLVWRKQRWRCPSCRRASTDQDSRYRLDVWLDADGEPGGHYEALLDAVCRVLSREYTPRLFGQGNVDFQLTRGHLGLSL